MFYGKNLIVSIPILIQRIIKRFAKKCLKEFCEMMKNDGSQEKYLNQFIEETKKHNGLRKQSVLDVLPELKEIFSQAEISYKL